MFPTVSAQELTDEVPDFLIREMLRLISCSAKYRLCIISFLLIFHLNYFCKNNYVNFLVNISFLFSSLIKAKVKCTGEIF